MLLTPNGLRVLDHLGVFERIRDSCYVPTARICKNDKDETTQNIPVGGPEENGGYRNHRIWRGLLLDEMRLMLNERGVPIHYNSKFGGIVSESEHNVEFLINEQMVETSLLIGADGIYSTVRKCLAPGIEPEYAGIVGVLAHINWNSVAWPYPEYERNATLQGKPGSLFWLAEDPRDEPELMVAVQVQWPEQSRKDLEELQANKDKLVEFFLRGYEEHGATARSILDAVAANRQSLYIWPFMKMPKLPQWYSNTGRVILCGDSAHAVPPSSGQGVNQALEDVYSLTLLLTSVGELSSVSTTEAAPGKPQLLSALSFWQKTRQDRIDAIMDWTTNTINVERMPEADRERRLAEGKVTAGRGYDLGWLHEYDYDAVFDRWLGGKAFDS